MFNDLLERGVIANSEWHHTSKFGNRTKFYEIQDRILFFLLTGDKEEAYRLYKQTRNHQAAAVDRRSSSYENKKRFLEQAADFIYNTGSYSVGTVFMFRNQKVEVISQTKRRKHPVCRFAK